MMLGGVWLTHQMIPDICAELGVHRTTVSRWIEKRELPRAIEALLDITHNGNLCRIHPDWEGWNIDTHEGHLMSPNVRYGRRLSVNSGKIMAIELRHQQIAALQRQVEELQAYVSSRDRALRDLNEESKAQAARMAELESALAGYTEGRVVAMRPSGPR